jgi:cytochrome c-type biogenesis protein CcmH/NrfF
MRITQNSEDARLPISVPLLSSHYSLLSSRAKRGICCSPLSKEAADSSSLSLLGMTRRFLRRSSQLITLSLAVFAFLGAGDQSARVNDLGHRMMCVCGCNQILLECNHVGCAYSDRMRAELVAAVDRGDNDDLTLQGFVQKYGTTVMAAPTKTGFNRVAWIMPYLTLVLGLGTVVLIIGVWRGRGGNGEGGGGIGGGGSGGPGSGPEFERFRDQARKDTET